MGGSPATSPRSDSMMPVETTPSSIQKKHKRGFKSLFRGESRTNSTKGMSNPDASPQPAGLVASPLAVASPGVGAPPHASVSDDHASIATRWASLRETIRRLHKEREEVNLRVSAIRTIANAE